MVLLRLGRKVGVGAPLSPFLDTVLPPVAAKAGVPAGVRPRRVLAASNAAGVGCLPVRGEGGRRPSCRATASLAEGGAMVKPFAALWASAVSSRASWSAASRAVQLPPSCSRAGVAGSVPHVRAGVACTPLPVPGMGEGVATKE